MTTSFDSLNAVANTIISGGNMTVDDLTKLKQLHNDRQIVSVNTIADLPSAANNTGRLVYVKDAGNGVGGYRRSDGLMWLVNDSGSVNLTSPKIFLSGSNASFVVSSNLASTTQVSYPAQNSFVAGMNITPTAVQVSGGNSAHILTQTGDIWSWGANNRLGDGTSVGKSSPVSAAGGFTWKQVSAGDASIVALKSDGTAWCWGSGLWGQLGDNTTATNSSPVSVVGGFTWKQVSAGREFNMAIKSDGTAWGWGKNDLGQLGNSTTTLSYSSPMSVVGGFTWKAVSAGRNFVLAIKSDDTIWTWGGGNNGQLGDGTTVTKSSPVSVVGGFTWKQVNAGYYMSAAIKSDDTLWTWGLNSYGQLGDNSITSKLSPVSVVGGFTWRQVTLGARRMLAIKSDDTLWTWGYNVNGALMDGTRTNRSSPVSVLTDLLWSNVHMAGTNWVESYSIFIGIAIGNKNAS